ncbi:MAG TPA: universal stress protein [Burkholderiales bacterium]|nr:universal stress protein [Burkholderiales bacterium]
MKILLAVDGSPHSDKATKALIKHAALYNKAPEIFLLYVHLPVPNLPGMHRVISRNAIKRYYREESEEALANSGRLLNRAKIIHRALMFVGPVAETIIEQAKARNCDLIYMGTRGMGGLKNMLLGSTAVKVLRLATIPVVLVK